MYQCLFGCETRYNVCMDATMALFSRKRYIFTWIFESGLQRALIIGERVRASDISFRYVPSALARASIEN